MLFQQENNELIKNFLNRTFLYSWANWQKRKKDVGYVLNNYAGLELDLSDVCELKCSYCYVTKFGKQYYPNSELKNPITILKNTNILFDWLYENQMRPKLELFGGDALNQKVGFQIIEEIMKRSEINKPICTEIVVPTNMNFIFNSYNTKFIEDSILFGNQIKTPLFLSASVDGIYMEDNRSFRSNRNRNEEFYDKLFQFAKKHNIGFHPMIYSNNIEKWWDNFMWFQKKFEEYDLPLTNMYLLEVRNAEWNEEQCKHLYEFMKKLTIWVSNYLKTFENPIREFFKNRWSFNILSTPFNQIGRGMGCSLQSGMYIRMGDLTAFPCHRLMYNYFKLFKFIVENGKITDIDAISPELYIATNSMNAENFPLCEQCVIKGMCSHGCLGSQFENTGDMFVPIPSVCRMEFYKIKGIIDGFRESGLLENMLEVITPLRGQEIMRFMEVVK